MSSATALGNDVSVFAQDGLVTGADGVVEFTPAEGFSGVATFRFRVLGTSEPVATARITVTGGRPPIARTDTLEVTAGELAVFEPSVLLDNDSDPDGDANGVRPSSAGLSLVGVGDAGGSAWLGLDGKLYVKAPSPGVIGFSYAVANADGLVSDGSVEVTVKAASTATDPTVPPTPAPTTSAPPSTGGGSPPPPPAPPPSGPSTSATTTTTPMLTELPATGGEPAPLVRLAVWLVALGAIIYLIGVRRRTVTR